MVTGVAGAGGTGPSTIAVTLDVAFFGSTQADFDAIGENSTATIAVPLAGITNIAGFEDAVSTNVRAFATDHGFTVPANRVLQHTFKLS